MCRQARETQNLENFLSDVSQIFAVYRFSPLLPRTHRISFTSIIISLNYPLFSPSHRPNLIWSKNELFTKCRKNQLTIVYSDF
jgi:hypothetical protein